MCGLVGIAGDLTKAHRGIFSDLLVMDSLRGPHSTGVMAVRPNGEVNIFKKAVLPHDLFDMGGYAKTVGFTPLILMGHNRYATMGAVNSTNAHPFEHGDIVGAHNGTLRAQYRLPDHQDFEVDSDNLIYAIDKLGTEEALKLADGAFALSLYNKVTNSIQLVRNSERPLSYAWSKDGKVVVWASEQWMIEGACGRGGMEIGDIYSLDTLTLHTFQMPEKIAAKFQPVKVKKVKEFTPPKQQYRVPHTSTHKRVARTSTGIAIGDTVRYYAIGLSNGTKFSGYVDGQTVASPFTEVHTYGSEAAKDEMLAWDGECEGRVVSVVPAFNHMDTGGRTRKGCEYVVIDPQSVTLVPDEDTQVYTEEYTEKEFNKRTKHGCSVCSTNLIFGEGKTVWMDAYPFCEGCWDADYSNVKQIGEW